MKILLIGATGLVGRHVLEQALADARISAVVAPVRRALPEHPKLLAPMVDYECLPADADWWQADAVICTLGTTMKLAGSEAAFRRVDHDYPLAVARLVRARGTSTYVLNSAIGADADSRFFYNRVKGELEDALADERFESLSFVRPGVIGGPRAAFRLGERLLVPALTLAGPLLPRRWRINPPAPIARALVNAAIEGKAGVHCVDSDRMV